MDQLQSLPKAEVHVHLEGTFDAPLLERWAREAGVPMPRSRERLFEPWMPAFARPSRTACRRWACA